VLEDKGDELFPTSERAGALVDKQRAKWGLSMGAFGDGAPGGTRTPTPLRVPDFESGASTGSATGACVAFTSGQEAAGERPAKVM
jgi:hypothetical protein